MSDDCSPFLSPVRLSLGIDDACGESTTDQKVKRRRSRDPLGEHANPQRYANTTLLDSGAYLSGSKSRSDFQDLYPFNRKKAMTAAVASWDGYNDWKERYVTHTDDGRYKLSYVWVQEDGARSTPSAQASRRHAIEFLFNGNFGCPPEDEWDDFDAKYTLPTLIMKILRVPLGSKAAVVKVMKDVLAAHEAGDRYDASMNIKEGRPRKVLIEDCTPQAEVVYRSMESGMSLGNTVVLLNQWRRARSLNAISYSTLQRFVVRSTVLLVEKREIEKSGSRDPDARWAKSRLNAAGQFKRQMVKALRISAGGAVYDEAQDGLDEEQAELETPLNLDGVAFFDEVRFYFDIFVNGDFYSVTRPFRASRRNTTLCAWAIRANARHARVEMQPATMRHRNRAECFRESTPQNRLSSPGRLGGSSVHASEPALTARKLGPSSSR